MGKIQLRSEAYDGEFLSKLTTSNFISYTTCFGYYNIAEYTVNVLKNTFPFLFLNIMVNRVRIHKMLNRIANREDPDKTASSEAV